MPVRFTTPGRGRFCSRHCQSSFFMLKRHAEQPQVGEHNPGWKGGVAKDGYRYAKRFRAKSPEKYAAQKLAQAAIRKGKLVRPETCSACSAPCKPHAHHDNYRRPLAVRWLCRPCHIAHHAAEQRLRRSA